MSEPAQLLEERDVKCKTCGGSVHAKMLLHPDGIREFVASCHGMHQMMYAKANTERAFRQAWEGGPGCRFTPFLEDIQHIPPKLPEFDWPPNTPVVKGSVKKKMSSDLAYWIEPGETVCIGEEWGMAVQYDLETEECTLDVPPWVGELVSSGLVQPGASWEECARAKKEQDE